MDVRSSIALAFEFHFPWNNKCYHVARYYYPFMDVA